MNCVRKFHKPLPEDIREWAQRRWVPWTTMDSTHILPFPPSSPPPPCVCTHVCTKCACTLWYACLGQWTACRSWFSPTMWVLGIEFRLLGLRKVPLPKDPSHHPQERLLNCLLWFVTREINIYNYFVSFPCLIVIIFSQAVWIWPSCNVKMQPWSLLITEIKLILWSQA